MEMSYLGIYEWVYEKVLSSIVTPVFDFVVSIINIAWGYVFQYILGPYSFLCSRLCSTG